MIKNHSGRHSASLSAAEEHEFVPFMHELIAIAFATIRPLFLRGATVATKSDASPVTLADRNAEAAMRRLIERRYPQARNHRRRARHQGWT